jgi:pilus assembly protein Flp/PilA
MTYWFKAFIADESAATAIEYALIASLIALALIATDTVVGSKLNGVFNEVATNLK